MADFVLKQTASEVQKAINNALNPDTTLTVSGKPADAKAVGDAIGQIQKLELDTTLSERGKAADAKAVGDALANVRDGTARQALDLIYTLLEKAVYTADVSAQLEQLKALLETGGSGGGDSIEPEVTLTRISAAYSGGSVPVGTSVSALIGVRVTAHYSDGSTATVTGYTLSGTIKEGSNTVTVSYGGKTTTFAVTGVADDSGDDGGSTGGGTTEPTDGAEHLTVTGATATDDGNGHVTVIGMAAADDGSGTITVF